MTHESRTSGPSRRSFVQRLAALSALAFVPRQARSAPAPVAGLPPDLAAEPSALRLGRAYLDQLPAAARTALLRQATDRDARPMPPSQTRKTIRRQFERGDIVVVDGWHLSRCEAEMLARAALAERGGQAESSG